MSHLSPDELVDAIDGALTGPRAEHVKTCVDCRANADRLRQVLTDVRATDVPEPSPLFWTHLAARVRQAIVAEQDAPSTLSQPAWLRWSTVAPVAVLALVVAALVLSVPRSRPSPRAVATTMEQSTHTLEDIMPVDDGSWRLVVDLIDDLDLDQAPHSGLTVTPGLAERAAGDLRPAERAELVRLLRAELGQPEL